MGQALQNLLSYLRQFPDLRLGWTWRISATGSGVKDPIALIDAILDAYDNQAFLPNPVTGVTHCNQAVTSVCDAMGYLGLGGLTADEIIGKIQNNPDWSLVPIDKAQEFANQGSLLIAGLTSDELKQGHGHVVIIRPGKEVYSGKWGKCPRVLNVGIENFVARAKKGPLTNQPCGLNESFVDLPKIWVLRSTL